jgi:PAS domain S-box-containing protein
VSTDPTRADFSSRLAELTRALAVLTDQQGSSGETFNGRLRAFLETVAPALQSRRVSLWRFDETRSELRCADLYDWRAGWHQAGAVLKRADYPRYFRALDDERLVAADDAHADPRTNEFSATYLKMHGIGAMLDVPIRHDDVTVGVLCVEHVGLERHWTLEEHNFALSAANVVATETAYEERRLALAELADSQARLFSIVNTAHDAFVGMNSAGEIVEWNAQAEATFGWTRAEAIGRSLAETIIPPQYREAHTAGLKRFLATGDAPVVNHRLELTALHRDGRIFPVELTVTLPLQDPDGFFFGAFLRDISERKRQDEELRRAKDAAEAATRAKTEFLANMSHELRTPLNGVLGYAQLLQRDPTLSDSQRKSLDTINRCGSYLLELINDVLDLSRIEAGRLNSEPLATDLRELLNDLDHMFEPLAGRKGLALTLDVDPRIPALVVLDRRHLRQVLLNLVGNAIKFTHAGGVEVSILRRDDCRMQFEVIDSGPGIEEGDLSDIFNAFHQTKAGMSAGGTGLGLTISQRLVRSMGGALAVESTLGHGSRFYFTLPLVPADQSEADPSGPVPVPVAADARLAPGLRVTALVADDNGVNRHIIASLLESAGIHVITAAGGGEAIEHARRFQPDIVFMDRRMRDLDGYEATRRLRADPATARIPVVAVSASTFTDTTETALQAGCVALVSKPIRADVLYSIIQQHVGAMFVSGRRGTPILGSTAAGAIVAPPDAIQFARRLREAAALGDVGAVNVLESELSGRAGMGPLARRIGDLKQAFDFDGLRRLADWLESREGMHGPVG